MEKLIDLMTGEEIEVKSGRFPELVGRLFAHLLRKQPVKAIHVDFPVPDGFPQYTSRFAIGLGVCQGEIVSIGQLAHSGQRQDWKITRTLTAAELQTLDPSLVRHFVCVSYLLLNPTASCPLKKDLQNTPASPLPACHPDCKVLQHFSPLSIGACDSANILEQPVQEPKQNPESQE